MNRYVVACRMHCPWKSWQLIAWQPLSLRMHDRKNCQACAESMTLCFSRDFQRFSETSQPFFEAIFMFFFLFSRRFSIVFSDTFALHHFCTATGFFSQFWGQFCCATTNNNTTASVGMEDTSQPVPRGLSNQPLLTTTNAILGLSPVSTIFGP